MYHSSDYKPRIFPITGDGSPAEIDRAQTINPGQSLNSERIDEIGNPLSVGTVKGKPAITYRLTQFDNGSIELWQKLVNTSTKGAIGQSAIDLEDFKTPYFDICAYLTDDNQVFQGTIVYPSLRVSGFSFSMGEPKGLMERGFDLVGESAITWKNNNKYYILNEHNAGSGGDDEIDLSAKAPVEDPDKAGIYIIRVVRVRSGVTTELTSADYSYSDGTKILTITSIQSGDLIKSYYTSSIAPDVQFVANTSDPAGILGDSCSIYLYVPGSGKPSSSDYIYRLQSANIDVRFTREDTGELGSKDTVAYGINEKVVTVTLGQFLTGFTIAEILRGVDENYGKIDIEELSDQIVLIVKVYEDNTKSTFKYGFKATGLSPTELSDGVTVNEYVKADCTLVGETLQITEDASILGV